MFSRYWKSILLIKWLKSLKKYYSNLTRILFSRLWLIRLSHRAENPLEKLILAVLNWPKLNLFDCLINGPITVDVIHLNHSSKIRFREPHFVRSSEVTDRPWIRIYPEELTLNLGKKEKKRVGFGFWSTDGLPREKKKENYQKDKKGLCFKLSYIFTFKSYWQVMIWKNIENDFWKLRVQKFMFY